MEMKQNRILNKIIQSFRGGGVSEIFDIFLGATQKQSFDELQ